MMRALPQQSSRPVLSSAARPRQGAARRCAALVCAVGLAAPAVSARDTTANEAHSEARVAHPSTPATAEPHPSALPAPAAPSGPQSTEPPPANLTEQAKQLYLLGAEAFGAQRNADAIRYFRSAARLVPSPKLTYNIALAYDEMGDTGPALAAFREFLLEEPDSPHRADVTERIAELQRRLRVAGVQLVTVASDPPGATLRVAGEALGVTPWTGELSPGAYQLRLDLPGYSAQTTELAVATEQPTDVKLTLEKRPDATQAEPGTLSRIEPLTWSLLGVGVGALAGGIAFELSRAQSAAHAAHAASAESAAEARGAAHAKQMASLLLLGAGGGFLIGGSVLFVVDLSRTHPVAMTVTRTSRATSDSALALPCTPGFCGLLAEGHF
jgi:tetratricopeptide (TPR) repeat protein